MCSKVVLEKSLIKGSVVLHCSGWGCFLAESECFEVVFPRPSSSPCADRSSSEPGSSGLSSPVPEKLPEVLSRIEKKLFELQVSSEPAVANLPCFKFKYRQTFRSQVRIPLGAMLCILTSERMLAHPFIWSKTMKNMKLLRSNQPAFGCQPAFGSHS